MRTQLAALAVLLIAISGDAAAHTRSESYSHWHQSPVAITAIVTVPLREVMLLYQARSSSQPPGETLRAELLEKVVVLSNGAECPAGDANILQAASGFVRVELRFNCGDAATAVLFRAMFDAAPSHVHYAKLHRDGRLLAETLLTETAGTWDIGHVERASAPSFTAFLYLGIEHIAGGIDHVAFLLGLLLVAGSLRRSIIAVTGFTLGHSVSLAAAVLGYVHADPALVEAFIGFTVALVAVEYFVLRRQAARSLAVICLAVAWIAGLLATALDAIAPRALLAYAGFGIFALAYLLASGRQTGNMEQREGALLFLATSCFGLVHGFGFAGFLMETGLLGPSLAIPLLGFNLGVEVGQLVLVAIALSFAWLLRGRTPAMASPMIAAGLCGIGVFWFVGRTFG